MGKLVCLLLVAQLIISPASAHSWYPKECCSDIDCRPVPCAELTKINLGWIWRGLVIFDEAQTRDSLDQFCHVCVKSYVAYIGPVPYLPICVFIPRATS
jgi:hypothetical protein